MSATLTLDDMMTKCLTCGGDGVLHNPEWDALTDFDDLPDFEAAHGPEEFECLDCGGEGYLPTETGQAIMDLVYRFMLRHRDGPIRK